MHLDLELVIDSSYYVFEHFLNGVSNKLLPLFHDRNCNYIHNYI